ncbi:MAG: hypothetical protein RLZZ04_4464 [Cyanobacteriota bacterium]
MFKDCKTGGYNLEQCQGKDERLLSLILLIAIAYTCAIKIGLVYFAIRALITFWSQFNKNWLLEYW